MRRSIDRTWSRPRPSEQRFWPVGSRASFRAQNNSRALGDRNVASTQRCQLLSVNLATADGAMRWRALSLLPQCGTMRVVFRCDPGMLDCLARPTPARHALPEWLVRSPLRFLRHTWARRADRQAIPSVRRCDIARFRHPAALRGPREQRGAVMGLGISGPFCWVAPTFEHSVFTSRLKRQDLHFSIPASPSEIQQFLND
jgi:hypothetical protein